MITAVMPSATMPTKAKLRVTLNRLRSVAKVSVASESAMQAITAAKNTQKVWRLTSQASGPWCMRRSMAAERFASMASCLVFSIRPATCSGGFLEED